MHHLLFFQFLQLEKGSVSKFFIRYIGNSPNNLNFL
jgi:hypothetical protein